MLAAARKPRAGSFKVPFKGGEAKQRATKPLFNPLAKDAVVLFNPVDLFSEK